MRLRYPGPFDAVDIPSLGVTVERGHQVEVTGDAAQSLLAQGWTRMDPPKPRAKTDDEPGVESSDGED